MTDINNCVATRQITVPFHGAELLLIEQYGQPYTPMKKIVEGMGLTWHGQHAKLKNNLSRWGILNLRIPSNGGHQEMICFPLRKLPGWLMSIESGKIKNTKVRERVIQYQNECDNVLWQYWTEGIAVNERIAYSVNSTDTLTGEQQDILRSLVETAVKRLPKEKQGKAIMGVWSRLKSHFKVSYRDIPQTEFTEAVSIVQRATVSWEVLDASSLSYQSTPLEDRRFVLTFRDGRFTVEDIPEKGFFITRDDILKYIRQSSDPAFSSDYIHQIAHACTDRMTDDIKLSNDRLRLHKKCTVAQ